MKKNTILTILLILVIVLAIQVSNLNKQIQSIETNLYTQTQRMESLNTRLEETLNREEEKGQEIAEEWINTSAPDKEDHTMTADIRVLFKDFTDNTKAYLLIDGDAMEMTREKDGYFTLSLPMKFYEEKEYAYRLDEGDSSRIVNTNNWISSQDFEVFADTLYYDLGNRIHYSVTKGLFTMDDLSFGFSPREKFSPDQEFTALNIFLEQDDKIASVYTLNKKELKDLNENTLKLKKLKAKENMTEPWKLIVEIQDNYGLSYRLIYNRVQSGNAPETMPELEIDDGEKSFSYFQY